MRPEDILVPTPAGVCCKRGGFHIDPTRPVERAVITHGHSDHARAGHGAVLATPETLDLMRLRYGDNFAGSTQAIRYGETVEVGGAQVSLHPAGHVLGSAQVCVEAESSGMAIRMTRSPNFCIRSRCFPSARISSAPIPWARRSA